MLNTKTALITLGRREYPSDGQLAHADVLLEQHGIERIIHGGARGDRFVAQHLGEVRGRTVQVFPADWETLGKKAGPARNQQMVDEGPDLVIAFKGGRGTADTIRRARKARIPVAQITSVTSSSHRA